MQLMDLMVTDASSAVELEVFALINDVAEAKVLASAIS